MNWARGFEFNIVSNKVGRLKEKRSKAFSLPDLPDFV